MAECPFGPNHSLSGRAGLQSFLYLQNHTSGQFSCVNLDIQTLTLWLQIRFVHLIRGAAGQELEFWCLIPCTVLQLGQLWGQTHCGTGVFSQHPRPHHPKVPASTLRCCSHLLLAEKQKRLQ